MEYLPNWLKPRLENETMGPDELELCKQARAYDLWQKAGKPPGRDAEFSAQAESEFADAGIYSYKRSGSVFAYRRDGTANSKEALSFLKDWVTALIQLETGALAVFGLAAGFSGIFASSTVNGQTVPLPIWAKLVTLAEVLLIVASGFAFLASIFFGITLLSALPGAVQRVPISLKARQSDVFSVSNEPYQWNIYIMSDRFRIWFLAGMTFFGIFALIRLAEQAYRTILG